MFRQVRYFIPIGLLALSAPLALATLARSANAQEYERYDRDDGPAEYARTTVWLGNRSLRYGEDASVFFRTEEDAYVTIVRVTTDGRMDVLFPVRPYDDAWVRAGYTERVRSRHDSHAFTAHEREGTGFVFAITSAAPFDFRDYSYGNGWGGRLRHISTGDPFYSGEEFAESVVRPGAWYSIEYAEYFVDRHYRYYSYSPWYAYHPHFVFIFHDYPVWYPYRRVRCVSYYYGCYYHYYDGGVTYVRSPRYVFKGDGYRGGGSGNHIESIGRRRHVAVVDDRRPGSPLADPNLGSGRRTGVNGVATTGRSGDGAVRPGDATRNDRGNNGRRRGHEADGPGSSNDAPGRAGLETPRRVGGGVSRAEPQSRRPATPPAARRSESRVQSRPQPDATRRPESVERRPEPRAEPRVERRPEPRVEPRRESRPEPRVEPRRESRPEPRVEPRRESRPEPRVERRPERRSEPQRESRPEPRVERRRPPSMM
ncbi:MAG: DUF4384 domain-containing protein [Gemmatimonadaceae bacterium]